MKELVRPEGALELVVQGRIFCMTNTVRHFISGIISLKEKR